MSFCSVSRALKVHSTLTLAAQWREFGVDGIEQDLRGMEQELDVGGGE